MNKKLSDKHYLPKQSKQKYPNINIKFHTEKKLGLLYDYRHGAYEKKCNITIKERTNTYIKIK